MVQKEVKKKTSIYGIVAILFAIVLISMVYAFGSSPTILPSSQTPVSDTTKSPGPTLSVISQTPSVSGMKTFSSTEELKSYLINNTQSSYGGTLGIDSFAAPVSAVQSSGNLPLPTEYWNRATDDYSTTNIQVAGVDEADTVKTDGQYIYTIEHSKQRLLLLWLLSANKQ
jgi:inhibitor of cysteine peptidase